MTSVLAPQGVGLWGQNLRFTGAVGVAPAIPSDAYNRNSIGQRGGSVITPIADVVGAGPSSSSRDPFNKQAATLIIRDEPKPRTLRDGFSGGEASFERGGIVTPIARTTLTEPEIKARLGSEGKSTRPASATPISLNDAIAMLRTAEETWSDTSTANNDDEEHAINTGYTELVSDAKRLKIIKGASMRRPITDEEQTVVTQIASKYASALGELSSDAVGVEAAAAAEDARPANQAASLAAAAEQAGQQFDAADNNLDRLDGAMADAHDNVEHLARISREVHKDFNAMYNRQLRTEEGNGRLNKYMNLSTKVNRLRLKQQEIGNALTDADENLRDIGRARELALMARDELGHQVDEIAGVRVEPSRSSQMRAESTARFAPHDRERERQAATMRGVMAPQFEKSRRQAADLNTINQMQAADLNTINRMQAADLNTINQMQAADLNTINRMQAERIGTDAHDQRAAASLQAKNIGDAAYGQRATAIRNVDKNSLATLRQYARIGADAGKQRADIADRIIDLVSSSAEETQQLLDDGILSAREDIAEALSNQGDIIFELDENYKMGRKREKAAAEREKAAVTRGNEVAAMEGRMATRYAQEQKTMREELIEPYTQMGSRLGVIEKATDVNARSGLQTMKLVGSMASSLLSTAASPVTITIQEGVSGQRGPSAKERLTGEWTAASVTDVPTTTTIHTPTLADGRRG